MLSKSDSFFATLCLNADNGITIAKEATQINFRAIMVRKHIAIDYDNTSTKTEHNVYMSFINKTYQMPSQLVCELFVPYSIFYVCLHVNNWVCIFRTIVHNFFESKQSSLTIMFCFGNFFSFLLLVTMKSLESITRITRL
jgi:hypothetical protein